MRCEFITAITELISIFLFTTLFIFIARKAAKELGWWINLTIANGIRV